MNTLQRAVLMIIPTITLAACEPPRDIDDSAELRSEIERLENEIGRLEFRIYQLESEAYGPENTAEDVTPETVTPEIPSPASDGRYDLTPVD